LKIGRHLGLACRCICSVPPAVCPSSLDLRQSTWAHSTSREQFFCTRPVHLGPFATNLPRREANEPGRIVILIELAINPAVSKRRIDGVSLRHALDARVRLR
jgi:hypothetical protein